MSNQSKLIILFFLFILLPITAFTQEAFSILENQELFELICKEIEENPTRGIKKLDSLEQLISEDEKDDFYVISFYYKGIAYRNLGNFELLYANFQKAKELALAYHKLHYIPEIHRELGDEYIDQEMHEKAKENYDIAKKWYQKFNDTLGVITCTYEGFIESEQGKHEESNSILKDLLPTLQLAHPIYLDGLSTIAGNYLALGNVDSAFSYVNKMPLTTIADSNNFNYSLHKYYVSFLYYLEKGDTDNANYYNNLLDKYRFDSEVTITYFKNKIALAKVMNNKTDLFMYTDSLDLAYENRLNEVKKEDVFTSEKAVINQKALTKITKNHRLQFYIFICFIILFLTIGMALFLYFFKQRKTSAAQIEAMKKELEIVTKQILANKNEKKDSVENRISEIAEKFSLSNRESDILHYIIHGLKNAEIAEKLFISTNTVKYHIKNLYVKLNVNNRTEISSKIIFNN